MEWFSKADWLAFIFFFTDYLGWFDTAVACETRSGVVCESENCLFLVVFVLLTIFSVYISWLSLSVASFFHFRSCLTRFLFFSVFEDVCLLGLFFFCSGLQRVYKVTNIVLDNGIFDTFVYLFHYFNTNAKNHDGWEFLGALGIYLPFPLSLGRIWWDLGLFCLATSVGYMGIL